MLELTPVAGALGAEVKGIDLCGPLDQSHYNALNEALQKYEVLFFSRSGHVTGPACGTG